MYQQFSADFSTSGGRLAFGITGSGPSLSLIDTLYSGLFMRLDLLKPARDILDASRYPRLAAWSQHLLGLEPVQNSVVPEFSKMYIGMVKMREGYISQSM